MAYIDQVPHRERAVSGVASFVIVATMGYAFVSGMAVNVLKSVAPPFVVHNWLSDTPPPPPVDQPQPKVRQAQDRPVFVPTPQVPTHVDVPVDQVRTIDLAPPPDLGLAKVPTLPDPGPPQTVDRSAKASPRGDPSEWVTVDDYPAAAIREGREGRTRFLVEVSPDGRPTACAVLIGSGSSDLDQAACRGVMRRARFNPGLDASGARSPSTYAGTVAWRLPGAGE